MSPTTNGERQPMRTRPTHGVNNILRIRTANKCCWMGGNLPIPQAAHLLIGSVLRDDELTREAHCEILEKRLALSMKICHAFFLSVPTPPSTMIRIPFHPSSSTHLLDF